MINIGFTGHRENKISMDKDKIFSVRNYVHCFLDIVFTPFKKDEIQIHIGGANGFDNWVGKWCIFNNMPYTIHLPFQSENKEEISTGMSFLKFENIFEKQIIGWKRRQKKELYDIVFNKLCTINVDYTGYLSRDRGIVDISDTIFAGYLGDLNSSGTKYTMGYGLSKDKRVVNIFDPFTKITEKYLNETNRLNFDFLDIIETIIPKVCQHSQD